MLGAPWLVFSPSARTCSNGVPATPFGHEHALKRKILRQVALLRRVHAPWVESRTGALTVRSGGYSVAFASGLSPAPLSRFQSPLSRTGRAVFPHLGSPVGSCVSHTGPRSHPWTTPMGLAPVPYSIHVRSRSAARPDALTTPSSSDDPFTFACDASGVSDPFTGVSGFRHSRDPSPFGHRSSPEAPSLHRHYPASPVLRASPPPCRPSLPLTGSRFGACLTTHRASHVAASFPFHACQRHYPGGSKGVPASLASPLRLRPSPFLRWVGPRIVRFEACSTFTRVPARMFAEPPYAAL